MTRNRLFVLICRIAIPLWVLAGAIYKLVERNPKLLPPPVFKVVQGMDGMFWIAGNDWLDTATRLIVLAEFSLVWAMVCMPRVARTAAIALLSFFCLILLMVIVPEFQAGGFSQAWKGSCGCFGKGGPNPVVMLGIDSLLLGLAILSKRSATRVVPVSFGLPAFISLSIIGLLVLSAVPKRGSIEIVIEPAVALESANETPAATTEASNGQQQSGSLDPIKPAIAPPQVPPLSALQPSAWPARPERAAPYYVPAFETWVGTRLDSQELALLMQPTAPESLNSGTWIVIFYREDCEHCHELMQAHFTGPLAQPTLAIAIPDTDPAASLEMPCDQCQTRTLFKGPEYVLTTPVMMKVVNGVITAIMTDPEDRASIEQCLAP